MSNGEFAGGGFSALLTKPGNSNLRPDIAPLAFLKTVSAT